ncbi:MAG TPA: CAP family protein [Kofleriaceae bacterium]|nr:CAP family protein [Kofleriaceae bacterium]
MRSSIWITLGCALACAPAAAKPTALPAEAQAFVDAHNRVRAQHCAKPLSWSPRLAQIAQQWANKLRAKDCAFEHSKGSTGENLAAGTTGTLDTGAVVQMWYDEVGQYKFPDGGFSMKTGHFTQVVWRGTTAVGCGRSQCKGLDIFVCEYDPPGNWEGQYRENVLPTTCKNQ